jgi:hypothetical protein
VKAEPGNAEIARKTGADEHRLCAIFIESFPRSQLNHSPSTRKIHAARDRHSSRKDQTKSTKQLIGYVQLF